MSQRALRLGTLCLGLDIYMPEMVMDGPLMDPFWTEDPVDIALAVRWSDGRTSPAGQEMARDAFWRISQVDEGWLYEVFAQSAPHARIYWVLLDQELRRGTLWWEQRDLQPYIVSLLEPFGQLLVMQHVQRTNAMMFHGCAVNDQGVGRLFIGQSGVGKSTMAGWYHHDGQQILSDEHSIVQLNDAGARVFGSPWPGLASMGTPGPTPMNTIYLLHQASAHRVEALAASEAVALLYPQMFFISESRDEIAHRLAWCEQLLQRVHVRRLDFAKEATVLDFVRQQDTVQAFSLHNIGAKT